MSTFYSTEFNEFTIDYGRGHTDSLNISDGEHDLDFWDEEIDTLIESLEEIKIERERIKSIYKSHSKSQKGVEDV